MHFRTEINIPKSDWTFDHQSQILTIGSCFSDVIGTTLKSYKFPTLVNPFGTIFNPISLFKLLNASIDNSYLHQDYFIQNGDIWYNYDFHSSLSSSFKNELFEMIRGKITEVHEFLKTAEVITITLGSAFVYRLLPNGEIISNCHKKPASFFQKELLKVEDITSAFEHFNIKLNQLNPNVKVIFTVSPVRHIKDTLVLNNVSKSTLVLATHQICEKYNNCYYFPSYEIMMDDLRDYRFYKDDFLHPTTFAEKYIWEKFITTFTNENTQEIIRKWETIASAIMHKPFHPESTAHQQFLKDTLKKLIEISLVLEVNEEISLIKKNIIE
ncbi:MAG: GSCFA domain-containing protein [Cytophagaceae bacterium]